jgi:O-antigen/teichoic acid export membrane protein
MTATSAIIVAYFSMDAILLPRLMTLHDAGRFLAARSLTETATVIGNGLATSLFPILAGLNKTNQARFARTFAAGLNMSAYLGATAAVSVVFGYFIVVEPLLGVKYAGLGSVVFILSLGLVIFFQGSILDCYLTIKKQTGIIMQKAVLALAIKSVLIFLFRNSLTIEYWAMTTILSAYAAILIVTYISTRDVFWTQMGSLNPRNLPQTWRTIRELA